MSMSLAVDGSAKGDHSLCKLFSSRKEKKGHDKGRGKTPDLPSLIIFANGLHLTSEGRRRRFSSSPSSAKAFIKRINGERDKRETI